MERDEIMASLRAGSWRDRIPEDDVGDPFGAAADLIEKLERDLAAEEKHHEQTIADRDEAQEWADELSDLIATLTGAEIGEHSNLNNPWEQAAAAAEALIKSQSNT